MENAFNNVETLKANHHHHNYVPEGLGMFPVP